MKNKTAEKNIEHFSVAKIMHTRRKVYWNPVNDSMLMFNITNFDDLFLRRWHINRW